MNFFSARGKGMIPYAKGQSSRDSSEGRVCPFLFLLLSCVTLREAVQAFLLEELNFQRPSKRRKGKLEQEKGGYNDSIATDTIRGRGNFPFSVRDRVIIKGNKRTPDPFVGREAIVTAQCLNGWYVVKALDNAERVKLQYRSLARVTGGSSYKVLPSKMAPNWL